ncbi:AAC(3) family N-acetyltransferase [Campylobacter lari]|nr:AAC(3) family N-acetyltransferase [Campylobacter lari]
MDVIDILGLKNNEFIILTGNLTKYIMKNNRDKNSINILLNEFIKNNKTIAIQTFNWDFCKNKEYDILQSPSQTGILGNYALKNSKFRRTKHPIYSFAVSGEYQEYLISIDNRGAFDENSIFNFMYENNGVMIIIDLPLQDSFTFVHYVEEKFQVPYRYNKVFKSLYVDENGYSSIKEYDMYVRREGVITDINPLEDIFLKNHIMQLINFNGIIIKKIILKKAFRAIENDIIYNKGYSLHKFINP